MARQTGGGQMGRQSESRYQGGLTDMRMASLVHIIGKCVPWGAKGAATGCVWGHSVWRHDRGRRPRPATR